jgi:hypothetical protein
MAHSRLQQLLDQLPLPEFFENYYGKTWYHSIGANRANRFDELVDLSDLERLLFDRDDREDFVQVAGGQVGPGGIIDASPTRHCTVQAALDHWLSGKSLIFHGIDRRLPAVSELSRDLEGEFKCRVWCNLYLTPAGSHAFTTHYDTHDVFVIQILGSKSWRIGTPAAEFPLPFQERQKGGPDIADACHKLVLRPHDVLYVPRGVLHDAVSEAELSCHLTVGLHPKTYLDLILTAVTIAADRDPRFRKYLPPGSFKVQDGDIAAAVVLMRDICSDDFLDAGDAFAELLASERRRAPTGVLRLPEAVETLSEADFFQAIPNLLCSLSQEKDVIELAVFGRSMGFPFNSRADIELCLSGNAFQLADIGTPAAPAERLGLVRRLILEGVVRKLAEGDDRSPRPVDVIKRLPSLQTPQSR